MADEAAELFAVRHAVERGWLTPEQARSASLAAEALRRAGRPTGLLEALRGHLPPARLAELQAVLRQALRAAGAEDATLAPPEPATVRGAPLLPLPAPGADERARVVLALRAAIARHPDFDPLAEVRLARREELGRGGMGVVHRVHDPGLGRDAALKLLLPDAQGSDAARRFVREVRITARLEHPSIPPVYVAGTTSQGEPYLLMKLIQGAPLARRLEEHDWARPVDEAELRWLHEQLEVLVKVGEAVAYAHDRGVVHRDLKPSNVMVGEFGEVLVMDWGLAKDLAEGEEADLALREAKAGAAPAKPGVTEAGATLGTLGYMSPEQAGGDPVDARTDVFALGALLVELLTGAPPFDATGHLPRLRAAVEGQVVLPRRRRPGLPAELDSIARAALEREPARRTPTAAALVRDLRAYLAGGVVRAHRYTARERALRLVRRHPTLLVAALAALLLSSAAGGLGAWALRAGQRAEAGARAEQARLAREAAERDLAALAGQRELAVALRALGAAQRWRAATPDDPDARAAARTAAGALAALALETQQWGLAHEAMLLGEVEGGAARVEEARGAETRRREDEARARLALVRARQDPRLDEAGADLSRHRQPELVAILTAALDEVSARLEAQAALEQGEVDLARAVCTALGRLGLPGRATAALGRYLKAEPDHVRAAAAGLALCRLGTDEALELVEAARLARGTDGPFGLLVLRGLQQVGAREEPLAAPGAEGHRRRGDRRLIRGDRRGAIEDYTRAIELGGDGYDVRYNRGKARLDGHDHAGALEDCTRAIALEPDHAEVFVHRGLARGELKDVAGALEDYARAIELDPRLPQAWGARGFERWRAGDARGAVEDLTRAVELDPTFETAWKNRSRARSDLGEHALAFADAARALELDGRDPRAWGARAIARTGLKDLRGALEDCTRAIELDPDYPAAHGERGKVRCLLGDFEGALPDLARAISLDAANSGAHLLRAVVRWRRGDVPGALEDLDAVIALDPRCHDAYAERGRLRAEAAGDLKGGLEDYARAIELEPENPVGHAGRAHARSLAGDHAGAVADATRALELDPARVLAWSARARSRLALGDAAGAVADFTRQHELEPGDPHAVLGRGVAREQAGDARGAIADLARSLELAAGHPEGADVRAQEAAIRARIAALEAGAAGR